MCSTLEMFFRFSYEMLDAFVCNMYYILVVRNISQINCWHVCVHACMYVRARVFVCVCVSWNISPYLNNNMYFVFLWLNKSKKLTFERHILDFRVYSTYNPRMEISLVISSPALIFQLKRQYYSKMDTFHENLFW